jgi:hypothetical protein
MIVHSVTHVASRGCVIQKYYVTQSLGFRIFVVSVIIFLQRVYFIFHYFKLDFIVPAYTTYEDGTDRVFRNVGT